MQFFGCLIEIIKILSFLVGVFANSSEPTIETTSEVIDKIVSKLNDSNISSEKLLQLLILADFQIDRFMFSNFSCLKMNTPLDRFFKSIKNGISHLQSNQNKDKIVFENLVKFWLAIKENLNQCLEKDIYVLNQVANETYYIISDKDQQYAIEDNRVEDAISFVLEWENRYFYGLLLYKSLFYFLNRPVFNKEGYEALDLHLQNNQNYYNKKTKDQKKTLEKRFISYNRLRELIKKILLHEILDIELIERVFPEFKILPEKIKKDEVFLKDILSNSKQGYKHFHDSIKSIKIKELNSRLNVKMNFNKVLRLSLLENINNLKNINNPEESHKIINAIKKDLNVFIDRSISILLYKYTNNTILFLFRKVINLPENVINNILDTKTIEELKSDILKGLNVKQTKLHKEITTYEYKFDSNNDLFIIFKKMHEEAEKLNKNIKANLQNLSIETVEKFNVKSKEITQQIKKTKEDFLESVKNSNISAETKESLNNVPINLNQEITYTQNLTSDWLKSCNRIVEKVQNLRDNIPKNDNTKSINNFDFEELNNNWIFILNLLQNKDLQPEFINELEKIKDFFEKMNEYVYKNVITFSVLNDKDIVSFPENNNNDHLIKFLTENCKPKPKREKKEENKSNLWFWMFISACGTIVIWECYLALWR